MEDLEPPHIGDLLKIGKVPQPHGNFVIGIVKRAGKHFDGRLWANVWHLDDGYVPVMSVIEWDVDHWRFESRAFDRLDPSVRATIEYEIAMHHKYHPKA